MRYIRIFSELSGQLRYASQKRILVEIAFINLTTPLMEQNLDSILQRITLLEQKMQEMPDNLQKLASLAPAAGPPFYNPIPFTGFTINGSEAA